MPVQIEFSRRTQEAWEVFQKVVASFANTPSFDSNSLSARTPAGDEVKFTGNVTTTGLFGAVIPTGGTLTAAEITCGGEPFMKLTGLNEGVGTIWGILTSGGLQSWFQNTLGQGTVQQGSDGPDDCTDLVAFLTGADEITGGLGVDTLLSGLGDDTVRGGDGADIIGTGAGSDLILGTLAEFSGDTVQDFSDSDLIRLLGAKLERSDITRDSDTSATWAIDRDGDGAPDDSMTINGSFSGGDLLTFILDGDCFIRYADYLQPLADGVAVAASTASTIANQDFLTGSGTIGFKVTLKQDKATASLANSLGVYEVDGAGNIVDVTLLFADVTAAGSTGLDITDVENGHKLGFFLIQDGANWAKGLAETDTLSFVDARDGSAANVADAANVALALGGVALTLATLHSFDKALNADGEKHALSGVDLGGKSVSIGFEDVLVNADNDCQDVVFCVEPFDL